MAEWFASGLVVDVILALMVVQGLALQVLASIGRPVLSLRDYLFNAMPGAGLMLALRGALVDAHWQVIAGCLLAALLCHWLELWHRARAQSRPVASGSLPE